jgi:hypothetical protein
MLRVGPYQVSLRSFEAPGSAGLASVCVSHDTHTVYEAPVRLAEPIARVEFLAAVVLADTAAVAQLPHFEAALRSLRDRVLQAASRVSMPSLLPDPQDPPWPGPLAPAACHGLAGDVVRCLDPHTEADSAAILLQFLVAFGNAAGRGPHTLVESTRHGVNEFVCVVGNTAKARKGTSMGHILRLFTAVEARQAVLQRPAGGSWVSTRIKSGLSSGEGLIWDIRDPSEPAQPAQGRLVEPAGSSDKRLLIVEGEFAAALKVLARDANTLSPILRTAWDGGPLAILTKNAPARATHPHVSIIGHITRDELQRHMAEVEGRNGFGNRFLWVCVKRSKELPDGGHLTETDLHPLVLRLELALSFCEHERTLSRDAQASAGWAAAYHALSIEHSGLFGALTARAEAHVLRLSMLYALLDCSALICQEHLAAALAVWTYCEQSARHIFGTLSGDGLSDRLYQALVLAGSSGMSRSDMFRTLGNNVAARDMSAA